MKIVKWVVVGMLGGLASVGCVILGYNLSGETVGFVLLGLVSLADYIWAVATMVAR